MKKSYLWTAIVLGVLSSPVVADEGLLGKVRGAETMPEGSWEFDQTINYRKDKGYGHYEAWNTKTEIEYGITDKLTVGVALKGQAIDVSGLLVDGYIPGDKKYGLQDSGAEIDFKYNFLSPALDDFGLSVYWALDHNWLDPHSGQDKDTTSMELQLLTQKYFMDGQLIWMGNIGTEMTYAKRAEITGVTVEWPTDPEMEIELLFATGLSYRVANNWFIGAEVLYETEFETEVGQERYSWFAGPSIHYGGHDFWATFSWLPQIYGGGETFAEQDDTDLHLIEKTKQEFVFKFGLDF